MYSLQTTVYRLLRKWVLIGKHYMKNSPDLSMLYLGYGENGPLKDKPGFDYTAYFSRGGVASALMEKGTAPAVACIWVRLMTMVKNIAIHQVFASSVSDRLDSRRRKE